MVKKRVIIAMSGGVDSSVAAALLVKKGYDAIGITMKIWPKDMCDNMAEKSCCSLEGVTYARSVAEDLGMPYYVLDLHDEFEKNVTEYFCRQYLEGLTPNPCIICNEKMKFGILMRKADELGAQFVATGHFATGGFNKRLRRHLLKEGKDKSKDQSYFLFSLNQRQLERAMFPLGLYTKDKVRALAKKLGLSTYNRPSSQDICFVQDKGYGDVIKKRFQIEIEPGKIIDEFGKLLGHHKGYPFYTIGQRHGLGVAYKEPLYVIKINKTNNEIMVGPREKTKSKSFMVDKVNWVSIDGIYKPISAHVKIRYNHEKSEAFLEPMVNGELRITFNAEQNSITPGQAAVFYDRDLVLGVGWIKEVLI